MKRSMTVKAFNSRFLQSTIYFLFGKNTVLVEFPTTKTTFEVSLKRNGKCGKATSEQTLFAKK